MIDVQGETAPGFEPMRAAMAEALSEADELGASFAVVRRGETLVELWGGYADRARSRPWARDTIAPVYSTTKGIAALVVGRLVGQGALAYDAPVSAVWPEFAAHGKGALTLGQLLSHQAGLPGFPTPIDPSLWLDPPACAAALAALPPLWPPGTGHGYHPISWGALVGEVVARATGRTLGAILEGEICGPLQIDFRLGVPPSDRARVAELARPKALPDLGPLTEPRKVAFLTKWAAPDRADPRWAEVELPSANGCGTALAIAQLYGVYAEGGSIAGREIISPGAFAELARPRACGPDLVLPFDLVWAAGVLRNSLRLFGPNPDGFGHAGWGGSMGMADPATGLSAGFVMNRQTPALMGDARPLQLLKALYACL